MAESDRSRSPLPSRNRLEPRGQAPPLPPELPFFPRWCGPMNASVRHFQNMSRPQNGPNWPMNRFRCGHRHHSTHHRTEQFPPSPPSSIPPTLPYPPQSRPITPTCPPPLLIQTHHPGTETMRQPESMGST